MITGQFNLKQRSSLAGTDAIKPTNSVASSAQLGSSGHGFIMPVHWRLLAGQARALGYLTTHAALASERQHPSNNGYM